MKNKFLLLLFIAGATHAFAQDSTALRGHLNVLCSKGYAGRGYVSNGMKKAAGYILQQFQEDSLLSFTKDYRQAFNYPVNTFPTAMDIKIDEVTLTAGKDYLINASSAGCRKEGLKMKKMDGLEFAAMVAKKGNAPKQWDKWSRDLKKQKSAYVLRHTDTINSLMGWKGNREFVTHLPQGVFVMPFVKKPIWTVSQHDMPATVIELYDSNFVYSKKKKLSVIVDNKFLPKFEADNIVGYVRGKENPDSFIVITAHYDHLGKMGNKALFPGASDNGSGTAMMLELAKYYAHNPGKYSMVFIAFAGEEIGLLGSKYFTENPLFSLQKIKFLINIDIMGDATDGLSVVNGKSQVEEYDRLLALNNAGIDGFSFKELRQGGPAANSDHYFFTEKGVPAFFIFSMGGKGYYHDIWDKAENATLKNIPQAGELLKRFIATF